MPWDLFRCPHTDCDFEVTEPCVPHTEVIGDQSEAVGNHCWREHRCVLEHADAWTHFTTESVADVSRGAV